MVFNFGAHIFGAAVTDFNIIFVKEFSLVVRFEMFVENFFATLVDTFLETFIMFYQILTCLISFQSMHCCSEQICGMVF